jgi:hypothetical protein
MPTGALPAASASTARPAYHSEQAFASPMPSTTSAVALGCSAARGLGARSESSTP